MISVTEKETKYLKDNNMYQNLLDSGGYITINGYLKRGNLNEHVNKMRRCIKNNKNSFLRKKLRY